MKMLLSIFDRLMEPQNVWIGVSVVQRFVNTGTQILILYKHLLHVRLAWLECTQPHVILFH